MSKHLIIMIDDNPGDLLLMKEAFKPFKNIISFLEVKDGLSGSEILNDPDTRFDLLILDINLPGKSGIELLLELRKNNKTKHTPVIMFSSSSMEKDIDQSFQAGANAFVTKPTEIEDFDRLAEGIISFWIKLKKIIKT